MIAWFIDTFCTACSQIWNMMKQVELGFPGNANIHTNLFYFMLALLIAKVCLSLYFPTKTRN